MSIRLRNGSCVSEWGRMGKDMAMHMIFPTMSVIIKWARFNGDYDTSHFIDRPI